MYPNARKFKKYINLPEIEEIRKLILNKFNNRLTFIEETHQYFLGKTEFQCVSHVVEQFSSINRDLMAENCAKKGETNPDYKYYGMTKEQILKLWDENSKIACDFGTDCHAFGESCFYWYVGDDDSILPECKDKFDKNGPKPTNPHEEAIAKFWNDLPENIVPVLAETKVINEKDYPYAGTFDILFYYVCEEDPSKNGLVIMDYKTNVDIRSQFARDRQEYMLYPFNDLYEESLSHYYLQIGCYQLPMESLGLKVIARRLIWLKPDSTYEKIPTPYMVKRLKEALNIK